MQPIEGCKLAAIHRVMGVAQGWGQQCGVRTSLSLQLTFMVCTLQPSFLRIENPRGLYAGANEKGGGIYAGNHYKYGFPPGEYRK